MQVFARPFDLKESSICQEHLRLHVRDELWHVINFASCKHASPVDKLQQWSQDEDRLSKMLRSPLSIRFRAIRITAKLVDNDSRL